MRTICLLAGLAGLLAVCCGFETGPGVSQLPQLEDEPPKPIEPQLKADQSFQEAQETLKQAAALPNPSPDDYGLDEARQVAQAQVHATGRLGCRRVAAPGVRGTG